MKRFHLILFLLLIASPACRPTEDKAPPPSGRTSAAAPLSKPDLIRLQREAASACKCARATADPNGKKGCWAAFEREKANREAGTFISPCGPISASGVCFRDDMDACVVTDYSSSPEFSFCTQEEAKLVEAALAKATPDDEEAVMRHFHEQFRRGESAQPSRGADHGCAG
jgi:hypothetical protein